VFVVRCEGDASSLPEAAGWQVAAEGSEPTSAPAGEKNTEAGRRFAAATVAVTFVMSPEASPVGPAVLAGMELADRLAGETEGVIIDPLAVRLVLPGEWRVETRLYEIEPREHVTVHLVDEGDTLWVHTHGLVKFGRPELELYGVPKDLSEVAYAFVMDTGGYVIDGPVIAPGNTLGDPSAPLSAREGTREREHWQGTTVVELHGRAGSPADGLRAWSGSA
jgi:nucleoid-associated protein YgaU